MPATRKANLAALAAAVTGSLVLAAPAPAATPPTTPCASVIVPRDDREMVDGEVVVRRVDVVYADIKIRGMACADIRHIMRQTAGFGGICPGGFQCNFTDATEKVYIGSRGAATVTFRWYLRPRTHTCRSVDLRYRFAPGQPLRFGVFSLKQRATTCGNARALARAFKDGYEKTGTPPTRLRGFVVRTRTTGAQQVTVTAARTGGRTIFFIYRPANG